jgi:polysaccharide biosynthesis transport protein
MAPNELVHSEPVALRILEHGTVPLLREAERTVDGVVVDVGSYTFRKPLSR